MQQRVRAKPARFCLRVLQLTLLILLAPAFLVLPVYAQDERVTVLVDGRALFRVGPVDATDAAERARRIEQRITTLLQNPQAITPAQIEANGQQRVISVAGVPVVTVTEADAQDNLTTVDALATQWAQALDTALQRGRERRLSAWSRFTAEVRGSMETAFARLLESAIRIIPRALAALLVLGLFWGLAAGVRWLTRIIFRRIVNDLTVENLIKQLTYYIIWALGLIVAVDALGFDPQTVVTGLGLTGLALGFALKDIISNFVSGVLILALRPFRLGDQIVVGATEGDVEHIDLRATEIRTYDGRLVLVPNAELFTSRVTNNTASPVRRGSVELFIGYDSDLRQVSDIVRAAAQASDGVLAEPAATVWVCELAQDAIVIEVRFWTDSRRWDYLSTSSTVRMSVVAALRAAGVNLPDPTIRFLVPRHPDRWQAALDGIGMGEQQRESDIGGRSATQRQGSS